jgi:hypothetical protein
MKGGRCESVPQGPGLIERCYAKIEAEDLERLARIAGEDVSEFFNRHERWRTLFEGRIICVALCQGAALHYCDGKNGVKDFDVWTFFAALPGVRYFPAKRRARRDFGASKFGRRPADRGYAGRRVDLLLRDIPCEDLGKPIETLQAYLERGRTESARQLSEKTVVCFSQRR